MDNFKEKAPRTIGKGLAYFQDTVDRVVSWGFGKLKDVEKDADTEENKFIKYSKQAGGFVGKTGEAFYDEYEKLKQSRKEK